MNMKYFILAAFVCFGAIATSCQQAPNHQEQHQHHEDGQDCSGE